MANNYLNTLLSAGSTCTSWLGNTSFTVSLDGLGRKIESTLLSDDDNTTNRRKINDELKELEASIQSYCAPVLAASDSQLFYLDIQQNTAYLLWDGMPKKIRPV